MIEILVLFVPILPFRQQPLGIGVFLQCLTGFQIASCQDTHPLAHILHDAHDLGGPLLKIAPEVFMGDDAACRLFQRHGGGILRPGFQKTHQSEKSVVRHLCQQPLAGLLIIHIQGHLSPQHIKDRRDILALPVNDFTLFEDVLCLLMIFCHCPILLSCASDQNILST